MRLFVRDFVQTFSHFFIYGVYTILYIIIEIFQTFKKFIKNIVMPIFFECCHDLKLFLTVILQGLYEILANLFLNISKLTLKISKKYHYKSEDLVNKHWEIF